MVHNLTQISRYLITQILTRHKMSNCGKNLKTQIATTLKNSNCDKFNDLNCDQTQKPKF